MNYQPLKKHTIGDPKRTYGEITDPKTKEIAIRFKNYQRKTAENIIEMSRIVIEAKQRADFSDFCILIGQSQFSSTIRKLEVIGKKYELTWDFEIQQYIVNGKYKAMSFQWDKKIPQ